MLNTRTDPAKLLRLMNTHSIKLIAFICLLYYAELERLHVNFHTYETGTVVEGRTAKLKSVLN